jgi:acetoin:2,6-dichlorophenolindophenol oxidoreductase subunit alpha
MKMRRSPQVSVAFFGDGCVEEGHVGESMNIAAVYRLPCVFVIENNLYSSHMHLRERRLKDNIVEMASLYGMPGDVVDGNDVRAIEAVTARAVARARAGEGPSLIECRTFRWRGHVGHRMDMDVGVSRKVELSEWLEKCPIKRLRTRLAGEGAATELELDAIELASRTAVDAAAKAAEAAAFPSPSTLTHHTYAETHR